MDNKKVNTRIEEIKKEINEYKDLLPEKSVPQDEKDFAKEEILDLEKELIGLYQEMGEVKTDIFYNPLIFVDDTDYILGGFKKQELLSIEIVGDDSALSFPKLEQIFDTRLNKAIELEMESNDDIASTLENYLEISSFESRDGDVSDIIKEHSSYQHWLNDIRERLTEYKSRSSYTKDSVNENLPSEVEVEEAENLTETATLIDILVQLMNKNQIK